MPKITSFCKKIFNSDNALTSLDFKIILILTGVFSVLVFFRLGNINAPQSYYTATSENRDVVLDFGDYIEVGSAHFYLGNLENRKVTVSFFNEQDGKWQVISADNDITSVFQWNDIDINYKNIRYLGFVFLDDEAIINELVFTTPNGQVITPVNTDKYPELFDEQEMFYSTLEKTYMDGTMFDEIYHGRTGYEFVHHLPTYETTHPQLGKCIIALGIKMFGMTPFGWRFFVAVFGILFVPLMYIFAKRLFDNTFVATCVGMFITFDCMHFTLSRIATIDIFVAFFIILSYYYMYRYITTNSKLLLALCGIAMGLAIATKLTGVYAGCGLAVILLVHTIKNWPKGQVFKFICFCFLFFIIIPLTLYTLAYIPTVERYAQMGFTDKTITWDENGLYVGYGYTGLLARTARNTSYMIRYHRTLVADHPFASAFYTWPIMAKPLMAANGYAAYTNGQYYSSSVSYIGNAVIWWTGIPCVLFVLFRAIFKKDTKALFLSVSYLAQYIPWMGVGRITFIYHYLPSILFTMLMMGYTIFCIISKNPEMKRLIKVYLILVVLCFILFYPVISGLPFPRELSLKLQWMKDWYLA